MVLEKTQDGDEHDGSHVGAVLVTTAVGHADLNEALVGYWSFDTTSDPAVARIYCDGEVVGSTAQTTYAMMSDCDVHIGRHKYKGAWYSSDGIRVRLFAS